jgi:hypothetical protein
MEFMTQTEEYSLLHHRKIDHDTKPIANKLGYYTENRSDNVKMMKDTSHSKNVSTKRPRYAYSLQAETGNSPAKLREQKTILISEITDLMI